MIVHKDQTRKAIIEIQMSAPNELPFSIMGGLQAYVQGCLAYLAERTSGGCGTGLPHPLHLNSSILCVRENACFTPPSNCQVNRAW